VLARKFPYSGKAAISGYFTLLYSVVHRHTDSTAGEQETLALASMARDDSPASSRRAARRPMRGKVGSEFET